MPSAFRICHLHTHIRIREISTRLSGNDFDSDRSALFLKSFAQDRHKTSPVTSGAQLQAARWRTLRPSSRERRALGAQTHASAGAASPSGDQRWIVGVSAAPSMVVGESVCPSVAEAFFGVLAAAFSSRPSAPSVTRHGTLLRARPKPQRQEPAKAPGSRTGRACACCQRGTPSSSPCAFPLFVALRSSSHCRYTIGMVLVRVAPWSTVVPACVRLGLLFYVRSR